MVLMICLQAQEILARQKAGGPDGALICARRGPEWNRLVLPLSEAGERGAQGASSVPVLEVYGWRVEGAYVFIYMELIQGKSVYNRWYYLSDLDGASICHQLRDIVSSLWQVEQDSTDSFIGTCFSMDGQIDR